VVVIGAVSTEDGLSGGNVPLRNMLRTKPPTLKVGHVIRPKIEVESLATKTKALGIAWEPETPNS